MKKQEKDELFAVQLTNALDYHRKMLTDGVRNRLLFEAIQKHVTAGTNFLDVGAGTGVWAILAAKLGARRVVAIEIEECLIPIIFRHAQENGVADRIEIVHGNSDDVRIRGKFDVIVSELFGQDAFSAETVKAFVSLRDRFLARDGILIPQKLALLAAPVRVENSVRDIPADLPFSCRFLQSLRLNYTSDASPAERGPVTFLAPPQQFAEVDFRTAERAPDLSNLSAAWELEDLSRANAVAVFKNSTFTDGIVMNNFESQSWGTRIYEFQPAAETTGTLRFELLTDDQKAIWSVTLAAGADVKKQTYSPTFAVARTRMAQLATPHRRFKPPASKKKRATAG